MTNKITPPSELSPEVTQLLTTAMTGDDTAATMAVADLWDLLTHTGALDPCAPHVVGHVLDALANADSAVQVHLLHLVLNLCLPVTPEADAPVPLSPRSSGPDRACMHVLGTQITSVITALNHEAPPVRHIAAQVLAVCHREAEQPHAALHRRLACEADPAVAVSLVTAIAVLSMVGDHLQRETAAWLTEHAEDPKSPAHTRVAAVLASRHFNDKRFNYGTRETLLACLTDEVSRYLADSPWTSGMEDTCGPVAWILDQYPNPGVHADKFLGTLVEPGYDQGIRASATTALGHLIARLTRQRARELGDWGVDSRLGDREAIKRTEPLVLTLGALLADKDPLVSSHSAAALTALTDRTGPLVEQLRRAVAHPDPTVSAWASAALGHAGHEAAVDGLVRAMGEDQCPWPTEQEGRIEGMLAPMQPFAPRLEQALIDRISNADHTWRYVIPAMISDIGAWGRDAAPIAPAIAAAVLDGRYRLDIGLRALGEIGPAAPASNVVGVVLEEDRLDESGCSLRPLAAWVHWRTTGDVSLAEEVIGAAIRDHHRDALRLVADAGPCMAALADTVAGIACDPIDELEALQAAWALWRLTGQPEPAMSVLVNPVEELTRSGLTEAALWATEHLGRMGTTAVPVAPLLEQVKFKALGNRHGQRVFEAAIAALATS